MIKLTVLGSGTSIPSHRNSPAHLVQCDDLSLLLDCGSGCTTGLFRAGVALDRLGGIMLSHRHPDHTAGLVPLLFALVNPVHPPRQTDLPIWGPPGIEAHLEALSRVYGSWIKPRTCSVPPQELADRQVLELGPLKITAFAVQHSGVSFAYRIDGPGASLCFSGDSGMCEALEQAAREVDLLLCECAALEDEEVASHLSATQVGQLAAAARCRRVVLTHLYPHVEATDPLPRVRRHYDGPVELAEDGAAYSV